MSATRRRCFYCGTGDALQELRNYGPGGSDVCVACVTDPRYPERETAAAAVYERQRRRDQHRRVSARIRIDPPPG